MCTTPISLATFSSLVVTNILVIVSAFCNGLRSKSIHTSALHTSSKTTKILFPKTAD
ncbi:hypothetical protein AXF42_Ash015873 [Apostasia shenzhenica]|uniref:Uncharacterized protein n=1 Tax=Apostasia shenzhenica TaxID=1088818 RepID=A0A2H9ZXS8_9ASPA|nr:hypothetical protein AXF42_Ash015873 [Apostasia shenzhenica]